MTDTLHELGWQAGERLLIYGIGNVGRQDDGLGIRLIERLEAEGVPTPVTLEANYQLNVEDSLLLSEFDVVLFADASVEPDGQAPFLLRPLAPVSDLTFSTHAMSAGGVLALCEELYGKRPRAYLMAMPGYEWDVSEELSQGASSNLEQALATVREGLRCMKSPL
jgi:hydrogenase maturation protease